MSTLYDGRSRDDATTLPNPPGSSIFLGDTLPGSALKQKGLATNQNDALKALELLAAVKPSLLNDQTQWVSPGTGNDTTGDGLSPGSSVNTIQQAISNLGGTSAKGNLVIGPGTHPDITAYNFFTAGGRINIPTGVKLVGAGPGSQDGCLISYKGPAPATGTLSAVVAAGDTTLNITSTSAITTQVGRTSKFFVFIAPNAGSSLSYMGEFARVTASTATTFTVDRGASMLRHASGATVALVVPIIKFGKDTQGASPSLGSYSRSISGGFKVVVGQTSSNGHGLVGVQAAMQNGSRLENIQTGDPSDSFGALNPATAGFLFTPTDDNSSPSAMFEVERLWAIGSLHGRVYYDLGGQPSASRSCSTDGDIRTRTPALVCGPGATLAWHKFDTEKMEDHGTGTGGLVSFVEHDITVDGYYRAETFGVGPTTNDGGAGGAIAAGTYKHCLGFVDAYGRETLDGSGAKSSNLTIAVNHKINVVIPADASGTVATVRVYRTYGTTGSPSSRTDFGLVGTFSGGGGGTFVDNTVTPDAVQQPLAIQVVARQTIATASITSGAAALTSTGSVVYSIGDWVRIVGAGANGKDLYAVVTTGGTDTATLDRNAGTTVSNVTGYIGWWAVGGAVNLATSTNQTDSFPFGRLNADGLMTSGIPSPGLEAPFVPVPVAAKPLQTNAGAYVSRDLVGGRVMAGRVSAVGRKLTSVAQSSGWGTGRTVTAAADAGDQRGSVTVHAGTGPGANPTVTLTFKEEPWPVAPILVPFSMDTNALSDWRLTTRTSTSVTFTFVGTPAASTDYILGYVGLG